LIRIGPLFHGARRKTGLLETSVNLDFGVFSWSQNQPRKLREASLGFMPQWYLPRRGRRKLRRV